jgi:small subunit ribosomal protein S16
MLRIRLQRRGTIRKIHHKIVVAEARSPKPGRSLEELGSFHPSQRPLGITLNRERLDYWVSRGAQMSPTVKKLVRAHAKQVTSAA